MKSKFIYYFWSLFTAPGVVVHELSHLFFCIFARVKVHKVKLFQFGQLAGFVEHEEPKHFIQAFLISFGPLIINSSLTLFLASQIREPYKIMHIVYLWFAVVVGLHAIPSFGDAKALFQMANHKIFRNPLILIAYPLILILYILNLLKRLHINIAYVGLLLWLGRFYL